MSGYAFDFLSGTVRVSAQAPEAWDKDGLGDFYRHPDDSEWAGGVCRVLYHESLHFWQFFASAYLANIVGEEWQRLHDFESTGKVPTPAGAVAAYARRNGDQPFSGYELTECWARFWEVHACPGQVSAEEAVETPGEDACHALSTAMLGGRDSTLYAAPYQWLLEQCGGDAALTALVFPIITHHAFGNPDPVGVFCEAAERVRQSASLTELAQRQLDQFDTGRLDAWHPVFSETILPVLMERALPSYASGADILERGALRTHPIFREYLDKMEALQANLKNLRADDLITAGRSEQALASVKELPVQDPWVVFAYPGEPTYRTLLGKYLPPPKVAFNNITCNARRPASIRLREVKAGASNVAETYADRSLDLEQRLNRFRAAEKAVALGLPPDAFETKPVAEQI